MLWEITKQIEGHTICALGDAAAWPVQVRLLEEAGSGAGVGCDLWNAISSGGGEAGCGSEARPECCTRRAGHVVRSRMPANLRLAPPALTSHVWSPAHSLSPRVFVSVCSLLCLPAPPFRA